MFEIHFYEDKNGKSEIKDYLDQISQSNQKDDKRIYRKVVHQLDLLEILGLELREPNAKRLTGYKYPLFELRPQPERFFYVSWNEKGFVLLSHYKKDQNKTDRKQILHALRLAEDWYRRNGR